MAINSLKDIVDRIRASYASLKRIHRYSQVGDKVVVDGRLSEITLISDGCVTSKANMLFDWNKQVSQGGATDWYIHGCPEGESEVNKGIISGISKDDMYIWVTDE